MVAVVMMMLLNRTSVNGAGVRARSPTQRAGLPPKVDVQARVKRSAEEHSPSLGQIAY
jgi:hypothetical protein